MTDKQIQAEIAMRGYDTETRTAFTEHAQREGCIRLEKIGQDSGWLHTLAEALEFVKRHE